MTEQSQDEQPFDERAALEELERLRAQIQRLRSERTDLGVQFEQFVRSVRATGKSPDVNLPETPAISTSAGKPPVEHAGHSADPATAVELPPQPPKPVLALKAPPAARSALIGGAVILLAAVAVVTWTLRKSAREPSVPVPIPSATVPGPTAQTPPPAAQPQPRLSSPFRSEIVTSHAAWVRVLADGERVFERELPPGARVPFTAKKTITIRTGNAGAVRLVIGQNDQGPLGAEGAVVTRTFKVPAR
jgi:hypothetical protein